MKGSAYARWSVMAPDVIERRLVAIVSADAVGYSRLMSADDVATVRTLTAYREELGLLVGEHQGRVVDSPGDNLLIEFSSAVAAVQCSLEMQRAIAARNAGLAQERRLEFRMGVHLGDVIVEGDRIYGDGVNVAARLEALAVTGGICVSKAIRDQVAAKVDAVFGDMGEHELKNIPEPVRVYRLDPSVAEAGSSEEPGAGGSPDRRATWIAVLPFDNLSGDPGQDYFADGITEDVITGLAAWRSLRVIARTSSFRYRGSGASIPDIAQELGVRFVLDGSVRKAGSRVRVTAQLIEAAGRHHVWADRYDADVEDIFDVQDRITNSIVAAIRPALLSVEAERVARARPDSLDAWDHLQRGWSDMLKYTKDTRIEAERHFEAAIELDPGYAEARAALSLLLSLAVWLNWEDDPSASVARAYEEAKRAVALDDRDALSYAALALVSYVMGRIDATFQAAERAIELNPSLPIGHVMGGAARIWGGDDPEEGIRMVGRGIALSPHDPGMPWSLGTRAIGHFLLGQLDEAASDARAAVRLRYRYLFGRVVLTAALAEMGNLEEAREELRTMLGIHPEFTPALLAPYPFSDENDRRRLIEGLRTAGLGE